MAEDRTPAGGRYSGDVCRPPARARGIGVAGMSEQGRVRVFLVDDHPIVRHGLAKLLAAEPDIEVCGEAADARSALEGIATSSPDVVLVDISLGGASGIDL